MKLAMVSCVVNIILNYKFVWGIKWLPVFAMQSLTQSTLYHLFFNLSTTIKHFLFYFLNVFYGTIYVKYGYVTKSDVKVKKSLLVKLLINNEELRMKNFGQFARFTRKA